MATRPRLYSRTQCAQCKKRKKKCDEVKPVCTACQRLHLPCTWESREERNAKNVFIKDFNPAFKVIEKRQAKHGTPMTLNLSGFQDNVCATYVLETCFKGSNFAFDSSVPNENGHTVRTTLGFASPDNSLAWGCIFAQGLLFAGARYRESRLIKAGTIQHSKMTKRINAAIADPSERFSMDTIASINNIGIVALSRTPTESEGVTDEAFFHSAGLAALISMMGPERFQNERALALFEHMRYALVIIAIESKRRLELSSQPWQTIPWTYSRHGKDSMQQLLDILCTLVPLQSVMPLHLQPGLVYDAEPVIGEDTCHTLQSIYMRLHSWRYDFGKASDLNLNPEDLPFDAFGQIRARTAPSTVQAIKNKDFYALGIFNMILLYLCRIEVKNFWTLQSVFDFDEVCGPVIFEALDPSLITPTGVGVERGIIAASEIMNIWEFIAHDGMIGMGTIYLTHPLRIAHAFLSDFSSGGSGNVYQAIKQIKNFWSGGV